MTRLLMTCDAVGGVWQYATDLTGELAARGMKVVLAVLGPDPVGPVPDGVELVRTGLPLDWLADDAAAVIAAGEAIARLAGEVGADIVHLNSPALALARFPCPVVVAAHGCVATWWQAARDGEPLDPGLGWHVRLSRQGLLAADLVVAPTVAFARAVAGAYDLPTAPIAVHNGRAPVAAVGDSIAGHAFTAGRLWDAAKGARVLDRVAARLSAPLRAAGPLTAPHGETVTTRHLHTLGTLDARSIAAELAGRPVYVSAASFEPFGLAVLEAAQAGCPLVLSDIGSFRELWDGVAVFVARDDDVGFTREIEQLLADPALADRRGRAAAAHAGRYLPERTAAAMASIYAGLFDQAEARAA